MLNVYKKIGETPLECLNRLREHYPEYKDVPLSYAGRLDPMAEGVLLVLVSEENKKREKYLSLDKEYIAEILFGFTTDTYDLLGKVKKVNNELSRFLFIKIEDPRFTESKSGEINNYLQQFQGKFLQTYPPYSSKTVDGRPLFEWARNNELNKIQIPSREVEINSIILENYKIINKAELHKLIKKKIALVKGDFRQKEILQCWEEALGQSKTKNFPVAQIKIKCSSGTYVRSLAHSLGETLRTGALALSIIRTRVGQHYIKDSICLEKTNT